MAKNSAELLLEIMQAGARVIHIVSYEWERTAASAVAVARFLEMPLFAWNEATGLFSTDLADQRFETLDEEATNPCKLIQRIVDYEQPSIWLLEDFHPFLEPHQHQVIRWLHELTRRRSDVQKYVLLLTPQNQLPLELRKEIPTLEFPLPDAELLSQAARTVAKKKNVPFKEECETLLEAARGLTLMEAELAYGKAASQLKALDERAVPIVAAEKGRILKQSEVLEYYPTQYGMSDVGGLDLLKRWLEQRGLAFSNEARAFGLIAPKGVLLLGVQGCGKSLLAKAIAATWHFPLLRFDLGKVFGSFIGQSESNMRNALQVAQALAPCVLWIDEIEKGLSGTGDSGDGGVTARVVGNLLTWMQEKTESVFVVATANRIDLLPPELLRKGRFDEIFFVDLPTHQVRKEILSIHLRKKNRDPAQFNLETLATLSKGFSGAELEGAINEGLYEAFAMHQQLTSMHIGRAMTQTFPLSRTMQPQIESLRQWAQTRARLATSEPPEPLTFANDDVSIPKLRQEENRNPFLH